MTAIVIFHNNKKGIEDIEKWIFGRNWPVTYIMYNDKTAYVGETLDAVRRMNQHLLEPDFCKFKNICMITNKTFNKSVALDLESFLIKYISADGNKILTNGNAGIVEHNYFYKDAYMDDFYDIWNELIRLDIVKKSILDIENSELFKYSPYKTLNAEQQNVAYSILSDICEINKASAKSIIKVLGGAGTGKTILAVYLCKLLSDITNDIKVWNFIDDEEESLIVEKLASKLNGVKKIGFVVPMKQLRNTMKTIFSSMNGLNSSMILSPEEVVQNRYDILIVDEAHRLYKRKHLPGSHLYKKFDLINRRLMGDELKQDESDLTELDWILMSSRIQVLFYDRYQTIRATDIGKDRFDSICHERIYSETELFSQMRCSGGNSYYEYIKTILEGKNLTVQNYRKIDDYEIKVVDDIANLVEILELKNSEYGLSRIVTGPGWGKGEKIEIDGHKFHWANENEAKDGVNIGNALLSIHKIQGFDLNYCGVIFGKEIFYDNEHQCLAINKKELKDNHTKSNGDENMLYYVLNIYLTLMTRGIKGTYIYAIDKNLQDYLHVLI